MGTDMKKKKKKTQQTEKPVTMSFCLATICQAFPKAFYIIL